MPRISDEELERLKRDIPLETVVKARGVELAKRGADLVGCCPFHEDKEPSFVITPDKNLWHCFGCNAGGSVIDFVMKAEGVSFRHAVELLKAGGLASTSSSSLSSAKHSTIRKLPLPFSLAANDKTLLREVVDFYHEALKQSPEALEYLKKRGLESSEMIDHFKIGFANRTLGLRLPQKNRVSGKEIRERLTRLGIYRETGHEHFAGSIVIPVFDEAGDVVEIYGRKITPNLRPGTPLHLYLPGPHKGVFNIDGIKEHSSKEIILCEALIDALTFWNAGFKNVTAAYGVNGFTEEHLSTLSRHSVNSVFIAYDRDEAGDKAANELAEKLVASGIRCYRIQFPKGMDANECALKIQPDGKSLALLLKQAVPMGAAPALEMLDEIETHPHPSPLPIRAQVPEGEGNKAAVPPPSSLSPQTPCPSPDIPCEIKGDEITITLGDRRYRIRGLNKNMSYDLLKVNILVSCGEAFHVDTLDLYSARVRTGFIKQASIELRLEEELIKKDIGKILLKLETLQDEQIKEALSPKKKEVKLTDEEREAALELLKSPNLLDRILTDFDLCGIVGEETNKLTSYLAAVSRKLDRPLAVIIQSSSAAGKTALMDAVLSFIPEEEKAEYSAMTGQALFYMSGQDLSNKILAIVEEEGAEKASYALKLLQSEGELTIASTGKDPATGRLVTQEYKVKGPVMIILTTTAIEIDEELLNRCLVLSVDEDREQTRAIHRLQREQETLEGLLSKKERERILKIHKDAQRLLRPIYVVNPHARELTFLDDRTRTRRDHVKYLTLIKAIALLHQYQRPIKAIDPFDSAQGRHKGEIIEYIEVMPSDIETANRLAHQVLGRSLDELPPQTRRMLLILEEKVKEIIKSRKMEQSDYRFSRRDIRQWTGWGQTQIRIHLDRLVDLEYILVHRGGRGRSFVYELLYDGKGKDGKPFLTGLLDIAALSRRSPRPSRGEGQGEGLSDTTTQTWRGEDTNQAGSKRGQNGRVAETNIDRKSAKEATLIPLAAKTQKNTYPGKKTKTSSYVQM